jgi:hypothetical protein
MCVALLRDDGADVSVIKDNSIGVDLFQRSLHRRK